MSQEADIFQRIREKSRKMSKAQRQIARYIEKHPDTVAFLTTAKLAERVGVGEATIIRFANSLGFSGYTEMQHSLQEQLRKRVTTVERLNLAGDIYPEEQRIAYEVLNDDICNLKQTIQMLDVHLFGQAARKIHQARTITVIALRSSHSLGFFLTFYLQLLKKNTELITESDTMFEKLSTLASNDLVIGISFPRYTFRTIQAMQYAQKQGIPTLAITDAHSSPLAHVSDLYLTAASNLPSFLDSFVAPLSLINALLTAVARMNKPEITTHLKDMEQLWEMEGIYHKTNSQR
ncbi:MurR/RpiR family transcriptional regulator [Thermoactinomyces mirandus]|uniref:MurR/RpiR family transcriptional regulator n=1 Tax=Thermoactinomyces mirandus TaxID=2756294 RepID=A0A7W1XPN3_9BACL|nr:MurR/RpiR family transcriptional regulator [Thermoactinomyces mirandus]MBA4600987.1 MurR/RpiR family transcriptional regulator [Thermoactinomyces mirandus]